MQVGGIINCGIMVLLLGLFWVIPRYAGLLGFIFLPFVCFAGFLSMAHVALNTGLWPEYDGLEIFWVIIWGTGFFVITLPLSIFAVMRFGIAQRHRRIQSG